jgi:hypothetical protein
VVRSDRATEPNLGGALGGLLLSRLLEVVVRAELRRGEGALTAGAECWMK